MPKNLAQPAAIIPPTHADISRRATALWENYGRPEGRDQEIWLEAERLLLGVDPLVNAPKKNSVVAVSFVNDSQDTQPRSSAVKKTGASASSRKTESASARSRR